MSRFSWLTLIPVLGISFLHPFGAVKQQHSSALLPGIQAADPRALAIVTKACQNCHSERTQWPFYSYLPVASWLLEKDVADARRNMNLSRWDQYSPDQQRDLLARIGSEVRSHRMPPSRYLLLHPEARLSESDVAILYEWTKAQRRTLRKQRE